MSFDLWLLVIGALLLGMALIHPAIERLPITAALVYLLIGIALGPLGFDVLHVDPVAHARWLQHASEIAIIVSLFTVGMKLRLSPAARRLRPALCLASVSMVLTVALIAAAAVMLLGLPLGAAVLLGATLAPTDPVLAAEVQIHDPRDRDKIRLTLSAEAGFNDGTAFPFVLLGLGLLGLHPLGASGWRWWLIDFAWTTCGGLAIGAGLGHGLGQMLLHWQTRRAKAVAFGEYLVLGLIGISYGAAQLFHTSGFLAVFAAGLALRRVERRASPADPVVDEALKSVSATHVSDSLAANPKTAPAYFAGVLLATNEQLEHIFEVALVLLLGAMLFVSGIAFDALWFAPLLFLIIRPLAALPTLLFDRFTVWEFSAVAWFGIRGIGSLYYLAYATTHGLDGDLARHFTALTLTLIALSILVHGVSVTPFFAQRPKRQSA